MKEFIAFLNRLEDNKIFYKLSKVRPEFVMVEVVVPGERWEIEFSEDDIQVEVFKSTGGVQGVSRLEELFAEFSD